MEYRSRRGYVDYDAIEANRFGNLMRITLAVGGMVLGASVLVSPFLQNAVDRYAQNRDFGVDHVLTGSIDGPARTYTIRRSVLSLEPQRIPAPANR